MIAPGVEISIKALTSRAAKLPRFELTSPSARSADDPGGAPAGVIFGFAGLIDGIVAPLRDELGADAAVIATGGMAATIAPFCEKIDEVDRPAPSPACG